MFTKGKIRANLFSTTHEKDRLQECLLETWIDTYY